MKTFIKGRLNLKRYLYGLDFIDGDPAIDEKNLFINNAIEDVNLMEAEEETAEEEPAKKEAPPKEEAAKEPKKEKKKAKEEEEVLGALSGGEERKAPKAKEPEEGEKEEDVFGEGNISEEELPIEEQYYIILLKDVFRKLNKLNSISLKLLNKRNKYDAKIINKIDLMLYLLHTFVNNFEKYENTKEIILKFQKVVNTTILFLVKYLEKR